MKADITCAEMELLRAIREKRARQVRAVLKDGQISYIESEENLPTGDFDDKTGVVMVRNMADYESVTIIKHQGKTAKAIRIRRMFVRIEDNLMNGIAESNEFKNRNSYWHSLSD